MGYIYSRKKISLRRFRKCISSIFLLTFLSTNLYSLFPFVAFAEEVSEVSVPVEVSETPVIEEIAKEVTMPEGTNPLEGLSTDILDNAILESQIKMEAEEIIPKEDILITENIIEEIPETPTTSTTTETTEHEPLLSTSTLPVISEVIEIIETKETIPPKLDFENNLVDLTLPENISEDILIKSAKDIEALPLRLSLSRTTSTSTPLLRNEYIVYENVFTNTDVEYKITERGLKENIILKTPDHPSEFLYTINLENYEYVLTSNILRLYEKGHQGDRLFLLYTISAPYMSDELGNKSTDISLNIINNQLVITPNKEWLTTAIYPVVVDPTVEIAVLNVHSHPIQGEQWNVDFTTVGTGDLTITPADLATINEDQFTSLFCGSQDRTAQAQILTGDIIFYPNWNCDEVATVSHLTLVTGHHHLIFEFNDEEESARAEAFNAAISWDGGAGTSNWEDDANWSGDVEPNHLDDVTIGTAVTVNVNASTTVKSLTIGVSGGGTASVLNFAYDASTSPLSVNEDLVVYSGASVTHTVGTSVVVGRINFSIGGNANIVGSITADSKGYSAGNGPGASTGGPGGSHGGNGGSVTANKVYGSITSPIHLGSGATGLLCCGFAGGGAIKLNVTGTLTVSGSITAAGEGGGGIPNFGSAGGAGGSIYIITGTIAGSGSISVAGGNSNGVFDNNGNGGGGRIAVYYTTDSSSITYTTRSGNSGRPYGGSGTLYKKSGSQTYGTLILDNASLGGSVETTFGKTPLNSSLELDSLTATSSSYFYFSSSTLSSITSSSTSLILGGNSVYEAMATSSLSYNSLTWDRAMIVDGDGYLPVLSQNQDLVIPANSKLIFGVATSSTGVLRTYNNVTVNGTLTHVYNNTATSGTAALYKVNWQINGDLTIASAGSINVDERGYAGGQGPGYVSNSVGGTYGGIGGNTSSAISYGSITAPTDLGSGGGYSGGGAVKLNVTGTTLVSGSISANGFNGTGIPNFGASGGAGGSIYLSTGTLSGSGSISAAGGTPNGVFDNNGNGGGGRIAIFYTTDSSSVSYTIRGGNAGGRPYGGSGTLYKKGSSQSYGDLILNNAGMGGTVTSSFGSTYVPQQLSFDNITLRDSAYLNSTSSLTYNIYGNLNWVNAFSSSTITALQFTGSSAQTLTATGTLPVSLPLLINSSATTSLGAALKASSTLTVMSGGFDANGTTTLITGLVTVNGGTYNTGTSSQTFYSGLTVSSGYFTASTSSVNITGNLLLSGGTLTAPSGTLNVSGNFSNTAGIFNHNNGTTVLTGSNQNILGTNTFYNLTKTASAYNILSFGAGTTQTVANTLTLSGVSGGRLQLRSTASSTEWYINPQGTRTISYLDVQDSENTNSIVIDAISNNSIDSGNNTNWIFIEPTYNQYDYRFYTNTNSLNPTAPLGTQSATTTIYSTSSPIRLLTNFTVGTNPLPSLFKSFKLQVATSSFDWLDIGAITGWWDESYLNRKKITFNNSAATENLTNFPVLVSLNESFGNINYSKTQNAGQDIRFVDADGTTVLNYEIEKWDETATSTIWVKVPQIDSGSSTDYIWMYYNNSSATDAQNATGVWDSNYEMVLHMNESSGTTAFDSTSNDNDGTKTSSTEPIASTTGAVGNAYDFDGSNDAITRTSITGISGGNSAITMEMWIKPDAVSGARAWIAQLGNEGNGSFHWLYATNQTTGFGAWGCGGCQYAPSLSLDVWTHILITSDGTTLRGYKNGVQEATATAGFNIAGIPLSLGLQHLGESYFNGTLDEVRISSNTRSASWVLSSYKAMTNTYNTYAAEESSGSPIWDFYNNAGVASGTPLTSLLLSTSDVGGVYTESNPTASNPNGAAIGEQVEWSFPLDVTGILESVDYYFRLVLTAGTTLSSYIYPVLNLLVDNTAPTVGSLVLTPTETTISASISGSSDSGSGLSSTPYIFYNITSGTNSGPQSATTWLSSGLTANTTYSFEVSVTDIAGNTATTSITTTSTLARTNNGNGSPGNGSGGGVGSPPKPPGKGFGILINNGASTTLSSQVTLKLDGGPDATHVLISNTPDFIGAQLQDYEKSISWNLCNGICANGTYGAYVKYYTFWGAASPLVYDTIDLVYYGDTYTPPPTDKKAPLQVGLGASLDRKNYFSPLLGITSRNQVSLKADTSLQSVGKDKLTYQFDCTSDGIIDYTVSNSSQTSATASNICTYQTGGIYFAKVTASRLGATASKTVLVSVGDPIVPLVVPPQVIQPPATPPPTVPPPPVILPPVLPPIIPPEIIPSIPPELVIPPIILPSLIFENSTSSIASGVSAFISSIIELIIDTTREVSSSVARTTDVLRENNTLVQIGTVSIAPVVLAAQYSMVSTDLLLNIKSGSDAVYALISLFNGLLTALGIRKRRRRWGTVYDAVTKQPLDPVLVELVDAYSGKVVEESITDMFGRFGFIDRPGRYIIRAHKTNYQFPSGLISGTRDALFENVYHGEVFQIFSAESVIAPNIPMDQVASDWNQLEKKRLGYGNIYMRLDVVIAKTLQVVFWAGFVVTIWMALSNPGVLNALLALLYFALAILNLYLPKPHLWGKVVSSKINPNGLLIELRHESIPDVVVSKTITNEVGKFTLKAMPGNKYIMKVKSIGDLENILLYEQVVTVGGDGVVNNVINVD